jgi:serine/threonine-protein kinase HipA
MMPSKMIDDKHFATLRFDRVDGKKKHTQTVSGLSSWDFSNPDVSTYENLFELSVYLNVPQKDIQELYRRMIFNLIFSNRDDHLKNHSFIYNENKDSWRIAPAYDLSYSINPLLNFKKTTRALSINSKRTNIQLADLLKLADNYTIKHPQKIIEECINHIEFWKKKAEELGISGKIILKILDDFTIPA